MSFEPIENLTLTAHKEDRFEEEFEFVEPGKEKKPVDTTPYTPTLVIEGVGTFALGSGLERPATNRIRIRLTGKQTNNGKDAAHWYLSFKEGAEDPETILSGTFEFKAK